MSRGMTIHDEIKWQNDWNEDFKWDVLELFIDDNSIKGTYRAADKKNAYEGELVSSRHTVVAEGRDAKLRVLFTLRALNYARSLG